MDSNTGDFPVNIPKNIRNSKMWKFSMNGGAIILAAMQKKANMKYRNTA